MVPCPLGGHPPDPTNKLSVIRTKTALHILSIQHVGGGVQGGVPPYLEKLVGEQRRGLQRLHWDGETVGELYGGLVGVEDDWAAKCVVERE